MAQLELFAARFILVKELEMDAIGLDFGTLSGRAVLVDTQDDSGANDVMKRLKALKGEVLARKLGE